MYDQKSFPTTATCNKINQIVYTYVKVSWVHLPQLISNLQHTCVGEDIIHCLLRQMYLNLAKTLPPWCPCSLESWVWCIHCTCTWRLFERALANTAAIYKASKQSDLPGPSGLLSVLISQWCCQKYECERYQLCTRAISHSKDTKIIKISINENFQLYCVIHAHKHGVMM